MTITKIYGTKSDFPYLQTVIVFIVIKYFVEQFINLRQIRQYLIKKIPSHINQIGISQEKFEQNQNLYYDNLAFNLYTKSIKMSLDVTFIMIQFMPFVWDKLVVVLDLDPKSEFQRGLAYLIVETMRQKTIDFPNILYRTMVIDKRYFEVQRSFGLLFYDEILENFLMIMIVPVFLYGYLQVVEYGGEYFFFYMQFFILTVTLLMGIIYPNYVQPLFNTFTELDENQLKHKIQCLSDQNEFPLTKILVMDGSKRSAHSNAYFFGMWNNKRIVLFDTLLNNLNDNEVLAVVAHEMAHWKYYHAYINLFFMTLKILFIFYLFSFFRNEDSIYISFGFDEKSIFIGSALFFGLIEPILQLMNVCEKVLSRFFEYQADQFAYRLGLGDHLMSGLIKLFRENNINLMVDPLYAWCHNSHPTIFERINHLQGLTKQYQ